MLGDGEQVEVGENPVEEVGLAPRVPVQPVEVDPAARVEGVDEVVQVGHGGVGEHRVQGRQPEVEYVAGRTARHQCEVLAGRGRAEALLVALPVVVLRLGHVDQTGVHGHAPGLARVPVAVLVGGVEAEHRGGLGQLVDGELTADADAGAGSGPAGEPYGAREQRGAEGVAGQLRIGAQPYRRQRGVRVCGHGAVLLADAVGRGVSACFGVWRW